MSKKQTYEILASQYYIEAQMSISTISKRLNISEKTLFNWKKEGEWDKKRTSFLKSQYSCNQTLYELLHLVSKKALEDFYKDGSMPDQKTLYFIMNMTARLKDLKSFEQARADEAIKEVTNESNKQENENKEELKQVLLQDMFKALLEG